MSSGPLPTEGPESSVDYEKTFLLGSKSHKSDLDVVIRYIKYVYL